MLCPYRTKEEVEAWAKLDPLTVFPQQIVDAKVATKKEVVSCLPMQLLTATTECLSLLPTLRSLPTPIMTSIPITSRAECTPPTALKKEDGRRECEVRQKKEDNER